MAIDHLTPHVIDVYKALGFDVNGVVTLGSHSMERARVEWTDRRLRNEKEQMVAIKAVLFMQPLADLDLNDRVTIDSVNYRVVKTSVPRDVTGRTDHLEAMVAED